MIVKIFTGGWTKKGLRSIWMASNDTCENQFFRNKLCNALPYSVRCRRFFNLSALLQPNEQLVVVVVKRRAGVLKIFCSYHWRFAFAWQGVNFNNILCAPLSYESEFWSFSLITVWLCIFWHKEIGAKAAHKMSGKFTKGHFRECSLINKQ